MSVFDQVQKAKFLKALMPDLYQLAWWLYERFNGSVEESKKEISRIPDYWEDWEEQKAKARADLAELKRQGK